MQKKEFGSNSVKADKTEKKIELWDKVLTLCFYCFHIFGVFFLLCCILSNALASFSHFLIGIFALLVAGSVALTHISNFMIKKLKQGKENAGKES